MVLSGNAPQQITLNAGGGRVYAFQDLHVATGADVTGADVTMTEDITVNGDMIIDAGSTFHIPVDRTLTILGTLTNNGTLDNKGTLVGG